MGGICKHNRLHFVLLYAPKVKELKRLNIDR